MQKASLRSGQVEQAALVGMRPRRVCGVGMTRCRVTVAWLTACKSWTGQ